MLKHYKLYLPIVVIFAILSYISWQYIDFLEAKRDSLATSKYKFQALSMRESVANMILQKQKATVAVALGLANSKKLVQDIENKNIKKDYYKSLIARLRENTLYKNIWIQILDKDIHSLYRSWSAKKGDSLKDVREDLLEVATNKKVDYSVSVGKFDLSIKAIVPLFSGETFVGMIEVISHFNSISKELKKSNVDSVVLLKKEFKKQLKYPFTKLFIDDYYVANLDAPQSAREYLKKRGVEKYLNNSDKVENGYIIVSYPLQNKESEPIAYYVMFKKIDTISNMDLNYFMFKWLMFGLIIMIGIAMIGSVILFFKNERQKRYYHNIIDSSTNIMIIIHKKTIIDVNKMFFTYAYKYTTLKEFKRENTHICDFFVKEEGYLQKEMNGVSWVDYLMQESSSNHRVKVDIFGKIYYFFVSASQLSEEEYYSIVFTDITEQEKYKQELEHLIVTDPLTGIGNRRYFQNKIQEETQSAKRYKYPLSLIMFDIDFFKKVNDKYGHDVGDEVLIEYTKLVDSLLREGDSFSRIGGEEFMIILHHTSIDEAQKVAEKIRVKVQEHKRVVPITMSFGVVAYVLGEDAVHLAKRVDDALYKAKESGRNMVVIG